MKSSAFNRAYVPLRVACLYALLTAIALVSGCATHSTVAEPMRANFHAGQYANAEYFVDELIADEAGVSMEVVTNSLGLHDSIDIARGETLVFMLEKSMLRLAQGDATTAVKLLRKCRDQLDANFIYDTESFFEDFSSLLTDDTARSYQGADYEHIMVRVMLALADLMEGGGDAFAYAVQVGEKQEEIIGSPLGELRSGQGQGYKPRENYRRVSLGAYIQGMIREDNLIFDEAEKAYSRALSFEGGANALYQEAKSRARGEIKTSPGSGALQVFYLGGRGPHLIENRHNPTTTAVRLAGVVALIAHNSTAAIVQAPVPVPQVAPNEYAVAPLRVYSGERQTTTIKVLDVNQVATEQLRANLPWIVARALARRAIKAVAAEVAGEATKAATEDTPGGNLFGELIKIAVSVATTATETADTRSWSTLPAEIQVARLELPEGVHTVSFGPGVTRQVRITAGRASYALAFQPNINMPADVFLDRYSVPRN